MHFKAVNKTLILIGAAIIVSLSAISPLRGQSSGGGGGDSAILTAILDRVNNLPASLVSLGTLTKAWMDPDTSDATIAMQGNFSELGSALMKDNIAAIDLLPTFNTMQLSNDGQNVFNFNTGTASTATPLNIPYANDLVYSSVLGVPYYPKDPREKGGKKISYLNNYIMNASGLNIYHKLPSDSWQGSMAAKIRYQNFYNTITAATSFNNYVISQNFANKEFNDFQIKLIQQATDQVNWFAKVGSENIGFVLRQMLIYQSQIFVMLTEVVKFQKQMVTAQTMNTSVLIAMNQINENALTSYAQGSTPKM